MTSPRALPRKGCSLATALALSLPCIALAAPGTIKRATDARTAPIKIAPLVEEVPRGTQVQADDAPTEGWRRVQLRNAHAKIESIR